MPVSTLVAVFMMDCLQAQLRIFDPVLGDADVQARLVNPEIFQQRLGQADGRGTAGLIGGNPARAAVRFPKRFPVDYRSALPRAAGHSPRNC